MRDYKHSALGFITRIDSSFITAYFIQIEDSFTIAFIDYRINYFAAYMVSTIN